jgi:hypothetical protein
MTNPRLAALYAQAVAARSGGDREGCPPPEDLEALAARGLPAADRLRLLDHVMSCGSCGREYALLDAVIASEIRPRRIGGLPLALAATVLLAIGAGLVLRVGSRTSKVDAVRGEEGVVRLLMPAVDARVPDRPIFVWGGMGTGVRYRFELLPVGRDPVYAVESTDTTLTLPDSVTIEREIEYLWWVRAHLPDGRQSASAIGRFRLASP